MPINVKQLRPFLQMIIPLLEDRIKNSTTKVDDLGLVTAKLLINSDEWMDACQAAIDSGVPAEQIAASLKGLIGIK